MDKLVFVKELKSGLTKNQKVYPIVVDQDNESWHIFNQDASNIQVNSSYLFTFEFNDKGFKDIQNITPLVNIFHQKALKEVASRNDVVRNLTVCLSYAKDLVIADKVTMTESPNDIYSVAWEMYEWLQQTADKILPPPEDNAVKNIEATE